MDFTAIDFETATRHADSACQLAAVRVRAGEIVHEASWLIRPRPMTFSPQNIQIHGITPAMVRNEREFGELWPEIWETFGSDCLIAHNASFDLGVLMACLQTHGHSIPDMQYSCTRAIARKTWPERPRFGLKPLSDWLGVQFRHHDALEDSRACAKIAIAAAEDKQADSLDSLESKLRLSRGEAGEWGKQGPKAVKSKRTRTKGSGGSPQTGPRRRSPQYDGPQNDGPQYGSRRDGSQHVREPAAAYAESGLACLVSVSGTDLQRLFVRAEFIKPLAGKRIVFTGTLTRIDREDADRLAVCCGGLCRASVSSKTDLLVVGMPDERTQRSGRECSVNEAKARELAANGSHVRIISEDEFLQMIVQAV